MTGTAHKLACDLSDLAIQLEDAVLTAEILPPGVRSDMIRELRSCRAKMRRQLEALAAAKRPPAAEPGASGG